MFWTNVCIEGYCLGEQDASGNGPCGMNVPSPYCLGNTDIGLCPHFAWSDTTEREVAYYPKLRLILWDRLKTWVVGTVYGNLRWWLWDRLWFNRRKVNDFFDNIPIVSADDCPAVAQMEKEVHDNQEEFVLWVSKAKFNSLPLTENFQG